MKTFVTLILIITTIGNSNLFGQKMLRYKDVYETVLKGDKQKSYSLLLAFQKQEPNFANTYFQLALIAEHWAKNYDPLTEPRLVRFFAYNTRLYYGLAGLKLKDEKGRNRDYYENGGIEYEGRKLSMEEITAYVNKKAKKMIIYEKNINEITAYFQKTVDYYNFCVSEFKSINESFSKVKNIYLSEDPALLNSLDSLKTAFDSSLYYFDKYRKTLDRFPVKSYDQNYRLRPIVTYRLHGLTQSNFLKNDILLWDYKTWVNEIEKIRASSIKENKTQAEAVHKILKNKIASFEQEKYSDNLTAYRSDEKLFFKIEKYDPQSLFSALIKYLENKNVFLQKFRKKINAPDKAGEYDLKLHTEYLQNLIELKNQADTSLSILQERISPVNLRKYSDFYMKEYGGITGLRNFVEKEKAYINKSLLPALERYKNNIFLKKHKTVPQSIAFTHRGQIISSNQQKGKRRISEVLSTTNGYLLSISQDKGNKKTASLAFADAYGKIENIKEYDEAEGIRFLKSDDKQAAFCAFNTTGGNNFTEIVNVDTESRKINTIIRLENAGQPTAFSFDALNKEYKLLTAENPPEEQSGQFKLYRLKADELSDNPKATEINVKGRAFEMIKSEKQILMFFNFESYKDASGKTVRAKSGQNIVCVSADQEGNLSFYPFFSSENLTGITAVKLNSNNISISGVTSRYTNDTDKLQKNKAFFIRINEAFKIKYSSMAD